MESKKVMELRKAFARGCIIKYESFEPRFYKSEEGKLLYSDDLSEWKNSKISPDELIFIYVESLSIL